MRIVCFLAVILFFSNCSNDPKNFPAAQGMPGEIILVMDSAQWKGPLGRAIDSIFFSMEPFFSLLQTASVAVHRKPCFVWYFLTIMCAIRGLSAELY